MRGKKNLHLLAWFTGTDLLQQLAWQQIQSPPAGCCCSSHSCLAWQSRRPWLPIVVVVVAATRCCCWTPPAADDDDDDWRWNRSHYYYCCYWPPSSVALGPAGHHLHHHAAAAAASWPSKTTWNPTTRCLTRSLLSTYFLLMSPPPHPPKNKIHKISIMRNKNPKKCRLRYIRKMKIFPRKSREISLALALHRQRAREKRDALSRKRCAQLPPNGRTVWWPNSRSLLTPSTGAGRAGERADWSDGRAPRFIVTG